MGSLVVIRGPGLGQRYPLHDELVVGRSFNSDVYVGDLNVSRRHARIVCDPAGQFFVEDLGSGNGTFINGALVRQRSLRLNDVLRIGGSEFRFESTRGPRASQQVVSVLGDVSEITQGGISEGKPGSVPQLNGKPTVLEELSGQRHERLLRAMYRIADVIAAELHLDNLLEKVLQHLLEVFSHAERGVVLILDSESRQLVPSAFKERHERSKGGAEVGYSHTLVEELIESDDGMIRAKTLLPDLSPKRVVDRPSPFSSTGGEDAFTESISRFRLEELDLGKDERRQLPRMGAPLVCRGETLGTLHLEGTPSGQAFSPDDLSLLVAIARQVAVALANARASAEILHRQRMDADLDLARQIQRSFLPQQFPEVADLRFHTHYVPAQSVGGDFYDIVPLDADRIGILVGDISGKGVSAALLMARLTSDLRVLMRSHGEPAEVLSAANTALLEYGQDGMFATVVYILLDLSRRVFTIANAGHQPPLVCGARFEGVSELDEATSVALGVAPSMTYDQIVYQLVPGDIVLLYTDGINEAIDQNGDEYGVPRLRRAISRSSAEVTAVVEDLVADLNDFVGGVPRSDDRTIVAFGLTEVQG